MYIHADIDQMLIIFSNHFLSTTSIMEINLHQTVKSDSQGKVDSIYSTIIPREKLEGEHGRLTGGDDRANCR